MTEDSDIWTFDPSIPYDDIPLHVKYPAHGVELINKKGDKLTIHFKSETNMSEETPCRNGHTIDKVTPAITDLYFANRVCDCGKLIFVLQPCGCPGNPHDELKPIPNPAFIPN